jgi:hypothetical protein
MIWGLHKLCFRALLTITTIELILSVFFKNFFKNLHLQKIKSIFTLNLKAMTLITIILIIIGSVIYTIIGNLLVRWFDSIDLISVDLNTNSPEVAYFVLGMFFPIIIFYVVTKEISIYIYLQILNYSESRELTDLEFDEYEHNLKRKENGKKSKKRDRYYI